MDGPLVASQNNPNKVSIIPCGSSDQPLPVLSSTKVVEEVDENCINEANKLPIRYLYCF